MPRKSPKKPTIIFIHGFRGTHYGLIDVASRLADDFMILTPDIPGSGTEPELDHKTLDGYAEWLHQYIKGHKLKQPYIVGHSMGSIIVSHFVERYPDDVAHKVVLMAPIFRSRAHQKRSNFLYKAARGGLSILSEKQQYRLLASHQLSYIISHILTYDKTQQKRIDTLHCQYSGQFASRDSFIGDMRLSMQQQTIIPQDKDTLLCYGKHDRLVSYKYTEQLAASTGVQTERIDEGGHLINYETPQRVADIIRNFLQS